MKRKQKTPRRIRPSESPDVDDGNTNTPEMETKTKNMEAETQTENMGTMKSRVPNIVPNTPKPRSEAKFRNQQESSDMPLILDVYSLSETSPFGSKQLEIVSKEGNSFPVTPPCSPPLVQLGAFKAIPIMRQSSQVPKRNANPCGYVRDNAQMFSRNSLAGDPRLHYVYEPVEKMANSSHLIANGVLPVAARNTHGQQAYADSGNLLKGYLNSHISGSNSSEAPISQLANMFSQQGNKYLVSKESFVTKGSSSLFARFKLQRNTNASENRPPNDCVSLSGEFPQTLTKNAHQYIDLENVYGRDGSSKRFPYAIQKESVANGQTNRSDVGVSCPSNSVIPTDNQKKCYSQSYLGFQQGYGRNNASHPQTRTAGVASMGDLNETQVSLISNPTSCGPTKGQSWNTDESPRSTTSSGKVSSEFLTPRDAKVQKLKRQLEEQEETLKRLRTSY